MQLGEILLHLGPNATQRTVIRWLNQLITEGSIVKQGQRRNANYKAVDPKLNTTLSKKLNYLKRPLFERDPVTYQKTWLEQYQPNITFYLPENVRHQLHSVGQRKKDNDPAGTFARKIYHRLLIDLSFNSSRLEGNTYSLLETKKLIIEGAAAANKLDEEKIMILNHKEAIRYIIESSTKQNDLYTDIRTIHYLLADGLVEPKQAGNIRDHGVRISATTYIPLENQQQLDKQLHYICNHASQIHDPFEQSFFLLVHIAYLQAFVDVNKRTSRLASNIPLINANMAPLSFNEVNKDDYISAMICIYELNEVQPLIAIYVNSYLRSCRLFDATAESLGFDEIRVKYRQIRRLMVSHIIKMQLQNEQLEHYIKQEAQQLIPKDDQQLFINTVNEDIVELNEQRIAGLGISKDQLRVYLELRSKRKM
ncbi:MAG: hypothetical protein A3F18_04535 [Legionellales bacterium RIFCSPHIGHO2_12_FULL_37_14]|nr:MAG: hypothetical protein A3F18_04535 [Legionellales bacterium RIFCSPHIGHO2_12_FULL_37_14]